MKRLFVIGVGCGDPDLVTMQAARMIAAADVFVLLDKGEAAADLLTARRTILDRYGRDGHRTVTLHDTSRDASGPYGDGVRRWHEQRVVGLERLFAEEVGAGETAGLLVWGDPSLYDSTLRIVDEIARPRPAHASTSKSRPVSAACNCWPPATASRCTASAAPCTSRRGATSSSAVSRGSTTSW